MISLLQWLPCRSWVLKFLSTSCPNHSSSKILHVSLSVSKALLWLVDATYREWIQTNSWADQGGPVIWSFSGKVRLRTWQIKKKTWRNSKKKINTYSCCIAHSKHVWLPSLIKLVPFCIYSTVSKHFWRWRYYSLTVDTQSISHKGRHYLVSVLPENGVRWLWTQHLQIHNCHSSKMCL